MTTPLWKLSIVRVKVHSVPNISLRLPSKIEVHLEIGSEFVIVIFEHGGV